MQRCRAAGISTALETCRYFNPALLPELTAATDLFLWDVKDTDDRRHRANTGVSNRLILANLSRADALGARTVLRCVRPRLTKRGSRPRTRSVRRKPILSSLSL